MGRIARPLTGPRAQQNDDLERRETDRRVASAAQAAQGVVGRHVWSYVNTSVPSGSSFSIPSWTRVRDDGIASLANEGGGIILVPGRWSIHASCRSDAGSQGRAAFALGANWLMDGGGLQDVRWRGSGFSGAGFLQQLISWSGPLDETDVATPLTAAYAFLVASGSFATNLEMRLQVNYLGPATFADVGGYETDPTS